MRILELFCGTKSIGKVGKARGHDVFSSDIMPKFNADYTVDILEFDLSELPWKPDMIWASPPCTYFSVASIGTHWNKDNTPKTERAVVGCKIVESVLDIIRGLNPAVYYIENPRGKLRKLDFMQSLPIRNTVTYCQYGDTRMKPTDIWTNNEQWTPRPMCRSGASCHESAPRGSSTGTQGIKGNMNRSVIPHELCEEIIISAENKMRSMKHV